MQASLLVLSCAGSNNFERDIKHQISIAHAMFLWAQMGNRYTFMGGQLLQKCTCLPSARGSTLKGRTYFQNGLGVQGSKQEVTKVVSPVQDGAKYAKYIQSPFIYM